MKSPRWQHLTKEGIEENLRSFCPGNGKSKGIAARERYASFDYCFNYFQSFYDDGRSDELVKSDNLEKSCLHLGFYLASWGMLRGSSELLQKSSANYIDVIHLIASEKHAWRLDVDHYDTESVNYLLDLSERIKKVVGIKNPTDTLSTKIMLGVFGCIPAFDSYFRQGFGTSYPSKKSLLNIAEFYRRHSVALEHKISTLEFNSNIKSTRFYTKSKLIDMIFFIEGDKPQL